MPLLTDKQLAEIRQLIEDYHAAFFINVVGTTGVEQTLLDRLIKLGLVSSSTQALPKDAFLFGVMLNELEREMQKQKLPVAEVEKVREHVKNMTFDEFKDIVKEGKPAKHTEEPVADVKPSIRYSAPTTELEREAIKHVERTVYSHLKGLGNKVDEKTNEVVIEADQVLRRKLEQTVQRKLVEGIESRKTIKQIGTLLGQATEDYARDWYRISATETNNAFQEGIVQQIVDSNEKPDEVRVFKRPAPGACAECVKAYLKADGKTPRVFKLSDLTSSGTNVGRKRASRQPVVGSHHPWCRCILFELRPGYEFDADGNETYVGVT